MSLAEQKKGIIESIEEFGPKYEKMSSVGKIFMTVQKCLLEIILKLEELEVRVEAVEDGNDPDLEDRLDDRRDWPLHSDADKVDGES